MYVYRELFYYLPDFITDEFYDFTLEACEGVKDAIKADVKRVVDFHRRHLFDHGFLAKRFRSDMRKINYINKFIEKLEAIHSDIVNGASIDTEVLMKNV